MMQASDRSQHCPFLNRTDSRCGSHFTLEKLEHAFAFCFDQYNACPVYLELLAERRERRGEAREQALRLQPSAETDRSQTSHDQEPLVELTIKAKRPPRIASPFVTSASAGRIAPAPNRAA